MLKTKTRSTKRSHGLVSSVSASQQRSVARDWPRSLAPILRGLTAEIDRVTAFISETPLPRKHELLLLDELHTLSAIRDSMTNLRDGISDEERSRASEHLSKKMQSGFSN